MVPERSKGADCNPAGFPHVSSNLTHGTETEVGVRVHGTYATYAKERCRCRPCRDARNRQAKTWPSSKRTKEQLQQYAKHKRTHNVPLTILLDARQSDKRKGFGNHDLTRKFVEEKLARGCSYCGGFDLRMTLDRIDNAIGHTQANVVPACIRCNYVRGSMPYEAWLVIAPAMREARILGLFGEWTARRR